MNFLNTIDLAISGSIFLEINSEYKLAYIAR